ncbi:MAG: hypothetical protein VX589_03295 [Myxococcota bacterium]|nr:hypothetical protein [Myxococcota bacterium]
MASFIASATYAYRVKKHMHAVIEDLARTIGFHSTSKGVAWGELDGHSIHLAVTPGTKKYTIRVELNGILTRQLGLAAESTASAVLLKFLRDEHEIGDAAFDRLMHIQGDQALIAAIFDAETRQGLSYLVREYAVMVEQGMMTLFLTRVRHRDEPRLKHCLKQAVRCAKRLSIEEYEISSRLIANLYAEPNPKVIAWSFVVFAERYQNHPRLHDIVAHLAKSPSSEVRLAVSRFEEQSRFSSLRRIVLEETAAMETRLEALREVGRIGSAAAAGELAVQCMSPAFAQQSAQIISQAGYRPGIQPLIHQLADVGPAGAEAIGAALTRLGGPEVEGGLVRLLETHPTLVSVAHLNTLGAFGTVSALPSLNQFRRQSGLSSATRAAADAARHAIRARLDSSKSGGLAVSQRDGNGALTLLPSQVSDD